VNPQAIPALAHPSSPDRSAGRCAPKSPPHQPPPADWAHQPIWPCTGPWSETTEVRASRGSRPGLEPG